MRAGKVRTNLLYSDMGESTKLYKGLKKKTLSQINSDLLIL